MSYYKQQKSQLPFYLIPIVIGLAGLLFARQLEPLVLRSAVMLASVSVPLFVAGYTLARLHASGWERWMLVTGVLMLMLGAMATVAGLSEDLIHNEMWSEPVGAISRNLGVGSLLLGLLVTVFSVVRSREAIEELRERFRNLADHMGEGFILTGADGVILLVNQAFLNMTKLNERDVVGQNARKLIVRLGAQPMDEHLDKRALGFASEYEVIWPVDGEERTFWVSGAPIYDRGNRHAGTLATLRDITEMKEMSARVERYARGLQRLVEEQTQRLRESEEYLRDLLVNMNEGFMTIDERFRIEFANDRLKELLRVDDETVIGRPAFDFIEAADRALLRDLVEGVTHSRTKRVQRELNLQRPDGALVPVMVAVARVEGQEEGDLHYSLVATDITELLHMQEEIESRARELEIMNEELRAHDRAKDVFLTNVSHELRTPLSTLRGYVEMLSSGELGSVDGPHGSALGVMIRNIERLENMIAEMIDFARMEIRGLRLDWTLFSLKDLVDDRARSVEPQVMAKDISLSAFAEDAVGAIWGDREKIGQVLGILLSNAVKFTPDGGMVQVRGVADGAGGVNVSVRDTGIGIESSYRQRIFRKFYQIDSSMTRRFGGTGIGLSIAKNIVEHHGGTIGVESEPNKGSTFEVHLPAVAPGPRPASTALAGLNVVVCSVDQDFNTFVHSALTEGGANVTKIASGYAAVRHVSEHPVDAVVLDDALTDISGAETAVRLREAGAAGQCPIVLLTQKDREAVQLEAGLSAIVTLLEKPFQWSELIAVLTGEHNAATESQPVQAGARRIGRNVEGLKIGVVADDEDLVEWMRLSLSQRRIEAFDAGMRNGAGSRKSLRAADAYIVDADTIDQGLPEVLNALRSSNGSGAPVYVVAGNADMMVNGCAVSGVLNKPFTADALYRLVTGKGAGELS